MKHLWEIDHPYYGTTGNYYSNECHAEFKSWAAFIAEHGDADLDMNLIYRFDWKEGEDHGLQEFNGDLYYRNGEVELFYMGQRKALARSVTVSVCRADEPEVIKFLKPRWEHVRKLWEGLSDFIPVLGADPATVQGREAEDVGANSGMSNKFDYELVFDRSECGSAPCTYYGLVTDIHTPADILLRWPTKGFRHADHAHETAEGLGKELVSRWNCHADLLKAVQDLMPYAQAAIGLPRESWSWDNVILQAERAIARVNIPVLGADAAQPERAKGDTNSGSICRDGSQEQNSQ